MLLQAKPSVLYLFQVAHSVNSLSVPKGSVWKDVYKYKVSVILTLCACLTPVCFKHADICYHLQRKICFHGVTPICNLLNVVINSFFAESTLFGFFHILQPLKGHQTTSFPTYSNILFLV